MDSCYELFSLSRLLNLKFSQQPITNVLFCFVCLIDLILYVPSTIFQLNRDGSFWVEPVQCVLFKDDNTVTPVRLETAARTVLLLSWNYKEWNLNF